MVRRGEVWWYEPPDEKRRPYVILTRGDALSRVNAVIAAPTTRRRRGIATEIFLDRSDGMPEECIVNVDNTGLIYKAFCTRRITTLTSAQMHAICATLARAIACFGLPS